MPAKVRVSHFTLKNIEINETTIPQPSFPKKGPTQSNKKPPTGIKLERISLKKEASYAGTPKYQKSQIIDCIVKKEVAVFRNIK